jgi:uncharacterized membrane protein
MEPNDAQNATVVADPADIEKNKSIAALSYIIFFLPLLAAKDSKFAMYHANQALVLTLIGVVGNIIGIILTVVFIGACVITIVDLVWIVLAILGILNALNGKMEPLPIIGGYTILK